MKNPRGQNQPQLPDPFVSGDPLRATALEKLRRSIAFALNDIIGAGPGVRISQFGGRFIVSADRIQAASSRPQSPSHPWKPYLSPFIGEGAVPEGQGLKIRVTPGSIGNRIPGNWNAELTMPSNTYGYWVWAAVSIVDSGAVTGVTLNHGATPPTASLVTEGGSLPSALYAPLFVVDTGENRVTRFYIMERQNLTVEVNSGGGCENQTRSVQLKSANAQFY